MPNVKSNANASWRKREWKGANHETDNNETS
jgi:hypothetical protein